MLISELRKATNEATQICAVTTGMTVKDIYDAILAWMQGGNSFQFGFGYISSCDPVGLLKNLHDTSCSLSSGTGYLGVIVACNHKSSGQYFSVMMQTYNYQVSIRFLAYRNGTWEVGYIPITAQTSVVN